MPSGRPRATIFPYTTLFRSLSGAVSLGRLTATREPAPSDAFILAVPTPFQADRTGDLSYIRAAAESIAPVLKRGDLVVLERSEEHTSELQSPCNLVCRLLLE